MSPVLAGRFFTTEPPGKPQLSLAYLKCTYISLQWGKSSNTDHFIIQCWIAHAIYWKLCRKWNGVWVQKGYHLFTCVVAWPPRRWKAQHSREHPPHIVTTHLTLWKKSKVKIWSTVSTECTSFYAMVKLRNHKSNHCKLGTMWIHSIPSGFPSSIWEELRKALIKP